MSTSGRNNSHNFDIEQAAALREQLNRAGTTNMDGGQIVSNKSVIGSATHILADNVSGTPSNGANNINSTPTATPNNGGRPPLKIVSKISQVINVYSQP